MTEWLDGPKIVAWMEQEKLLGDGVRAREPGLGRRILDWRKGGRADLSTVDRFLLRQGRSLSEVPESFFIKTAHNNVAPHEREKLSEEQVKRLQKGFRRRVPYKILAAALGVPENQVRVELQEWRKR